MDTIFEQENVASRANTTWLSNGIYRMFLTERGTGFSAYHDYLLTGWDADPVEDSNGFFLYIRDLDSGAFWSASAAPLPQQTSGTVERTAGACIIRRSHQGITSRVEVCVPAGMDVELRRLSLHNQGNRPRRLEVTSYIEAVLNHPAGHASHPAFSKLFVQTEWHAGRNAVIARRRPRSNTERHPCMAHALVGAGVKQWETDRVRFLGRGRDWTCPQALTAQAPLNGTVGNVLDPALSLRTIVTVPPGETVSLCFLLGAADDRERLLAQVDACSPQTIDEAFRVARQGETFAEALAGKNGALWRQLTAGFGDGPAVVALPARPDSSVQESWPDEKAETLQFFNGFGGFSADGSEYVIRLGRDASGYLRLPPMPWTNVVANERCGFVVSEKGAGTLWNGNSREHRLTPWRNDPVVDPHDDAFYLRDEANGEFWSPLPGPAPANSGYEVRHGFGYSQWRHHSHGLAQETTLFVPENDPLRIARIRIANTGTDKRRVSVYGYQRLVLGVLPQETRASVAMEYDVARKVLLGRNSGAGAFREGIAFAAAAAEGAASLSWTADRASFLGRAGSPGNPAALHAGGDLPGATGSEPCAALRIELEIEPGATAQVAFLLGETNSPEELDRLLAAYRLPGAADAALDGVRGFWKETLMRVQIQTPVPAIDLMVNGWLAYQNLACRLWGRTAFYQSGGAYGFRDQLQDTSGLLYLRPDLLRRQILRNAAHQFVEGDVMHWWHPPLSRGIRTRFADDLLWLPYLTAYYIRSTGDQGVLEESVRFLTAPLLKPDEDEVFLQPEDSGQSADVYEHCCRTLDRSLTRGAHGLPLFGCGDWNDGMNRVGHGGKGESVWMGFFIVTIIEDFLPYCEARGDAARIASYRAYRTEMLKTLNDTGWDGEWYRRAYYDNGAPLGSRESDECRIDALAQAWAVISKTAPKERADVALDALEKHLISDQDKIIRLLAPPFVNTPHDPGYIKGYVAGVRENGGQYTHAALWVAKAMAEAGRRDRAAQLLEMISPVTHANTPENVERYKVEPYVIVADVYGVEPHMGRGGWSWYTGSAGWMYRVAVESLLGFTLENGNAIRLEPRIPDQWPGYRMTYSLADGTSYHIEVSSQSTCAGRIISASLDGTLLEPGARGVRIPLLDDSKAHQVRLTLG